MKNAKRVQASSLTSGSPRWLVCFAVALVAATFLAYQPAWHGTPLLDDKDHLISTPELRSLQGLSDLWFAPHTTRQYHPLLDTVFWIEDKLWGQSMLGYHLVSILCHAGSALVLLAILRRLQVPGAWLAAAIFALHPVHVESVAWIVELKNTLSGLFFFLCILTYLRFDESRNRKTYFLVLLLFSLGILVKTIVAAAPAILLLLIWWRRRKIAWKRDVQPLLPFLVLGAAAGILTAWMERALSGAEGEEFEFSALDRVLIAGRAFWFYLGKLFWPRNLSLIYPRWNLESTQWWQFLFPVAAICLCGTAVLFQRRHRWLLVSLSVFAILVGPLLGFFNVAFFRFSFVADHFQYLPSVGIITPVAAGIALFAARTSGASRVVVYGACGALIVALTTLTWRQARMYQDSETCYRTVIERNPASWEAHINVGAELFKRGSLDEAEAEFRKVLELGPNYAPAAKRAYISLGNIALKRGEWDDSIAYIEKSLQIDPAYPPAHTAIGSALHRVGRLRESIAHYETSVVLRPKSASNHSNLAWMLATCGDPALRDGPRALELAQKADKLSGDASPKVLRSLAAAYAETGRFVEASQTARRALELGRDQGATPFNESLRQEIAMYDRSVPYHENGR